MSALDELLADVAGRGLRVEVDGSGVPHLKGDGSRVTPSLLRALRAFRGELLELLGGGELCSAEEVSADGGTSPASPKAEIPAKVLSPARQPPQRCPACGKRDLDARGICWELKCDYRRCETCGGNTHGQFIQNCDRCGREMGG